MELNHLKYFYVVASSGSFTQASKVLHVVQPALTRAVKLLEESLSAVLLERSQKGVTLTAAGRSVYTECQTIFERVDVLEKSFKIQKAGELSLTVCGNDVFIAYLFPPAFQQLRASFPNLRPVALSTPAYLMSQQLETKEPDKRSLPWDFGIFFHVPPLPPNLQVKEIASLRFKLVVAYAKRKDSQVLSQFIGSREVDDPQNKRFPMLTRLRKDYPNATLDVSSNSLIAHRQMVLLGWGVSILPAFLIEEDIREKRLADVYPDETYHFALRMVAPKDRTPSLVATAFVKCLLTHCATLRS